MPKEEIIWNLRNGGCIDLLTVDQEDFENAGIDLESLTDEELYTAIETMRENLCNDLSYSVVTAVQFAETVHSQT